MTEEQIKQNAYEYLANIDRSGVLLTGNEVYLAFIAGAHSRDEEIEQNDPWISVDVQLPTEKDGGEDGYRSKPVFAKIQRLDGSIYHIVTCYYYDNNADPVYGWPIDLSTGDRVTHWMDIPE